MKFSIKDFFSKRDRFHSFLRNWSHLLKKSLMENFIFCAVMVPLQYSGYHYCKTSKSCPIFAMVSTLMVPSGNKP